MFLMLLFCLVFNLLMNLSSGFLIAVAEGEIVI